MDDWIISQYKAAIKKYTGKDFPTDPHEQVWGAIGAVFGSWMNDRACVYRRQYGIPDEWGTACNVMAMVFGNLGDDCATGVALTRDGALGTPGMCGDYLINAQGEDVVAGIRSPKRIEETLRGTTRIAANALLRVPHRSCKRQVVQRFRTR
jgi:pyruvate,orthophosphate dikinase